ncbi:MAG TPA: copper chaperone PCu(A)C [Wenzhouxiangellaceae bacterium]|nr:copper chaperone PCu(A)C [Wenzhouxiangellaceae bacterium]
MKLASAIVALVALLAGALWWVGQVAPESPIEVGNARVRLVPGGGPMAGYMEIRNHSDSVIRLVGAASPAFGNVMIHRTIVRDGRARMQHQSDGVPIVPGDSATFKPRDLHLMLMQPKGALEVGDQVEIVLRFEGIDPADWPVAFTVVPVTSQ